MAQYSFASQKLPNDPEKTSTETSLSYYLENIPPRFKALFQLVRSLWVLSSNHNARQFILIRILDAVGFGDEN
jgi:hypothetical protein